MIPHWLGDMMDEGSELVASNNGFEGRFPCGSSSFSFLDISHNSFSGFIPSCINFHYTEHLHLGSNKFTGAIPAFRNMTQVLTLDIGDNSLSGRIPEFLGNLSNLRILILRKNNFSGSIPKQLCQLPNVSLIDISSNSLSGSIPSCLQNIISPITPVFIPGGGKTNSVSSSYAYQGVLNRDFAWSPGIDWFSILGKQDEVQFTTKALSLAYKGGILDLMVGLDLSCNKLTGEIPKELGSLNQIHSLNLSHNLLNGTIPIQFSNLEKIESLDLSSNRLSGEVPSQLINLSSLAVFNVSHNNLSGKLPEMKAQFGTFSKESYDGNPLLCGPPLEKCVASTSQVNDPSAKEDGDKWLDIDFLASFYGTWVVFMLGFAAVLYINPYWRRRWLEFVEEFTITIFVLSFAYNNLNGTLPYLGLCELKNLYELDLSHNLFTGEVPQCFNNLSSLKLLDISSNQFTRMFMSSPIVNLTSLEYVDFSNNKFEGSFSFNLLSNHPKLEVVVFMCDNDKFEVETEEPTDWVPMFQLKILVLSNCNVNKAKGSVIPGFLVHQHKLRVVDLSHNSLVGDFPNWLIKNNTMLEGLSLRNNSFGGDISMLPYKNANTQRLDMSGNHVNGTIPSDIQKFLPNLGYFNLSSNSLNGVIPSSIGDLSELWALDLSDNKLSGEVPKELFTDLSSLQILKLSNNMLHGEVLSGNLSLGNIKRLHLDSNCFSGKIGNETNDNNIILELLDISNNGFTGMIPQWISNTGGTSFELVVRNNSLEGRFPCGTASFSFLDISQNSFSGPIPSCENFQNLKHIHLGFNRFIGSIPHSFRKLTEVLTLDVGNNFLSGKVPTFLGELSHLRILILRKNNFSGSIPKKLCRLSEMSLIDLSSNSFSGSIPSCLQNITTPSYHAFGKTTNGALGSSFYHYVGYLHRNDVSSTMYNTDMFETEDEVQFTTKALSLAYKGSILDYLVGLDLSDNKLTGEIPKELGLLTEIHSLNLSHNQLSGPIPMEFSNLKKIESLDLSSNGLTGKVPSQLVQLTFLAVFSVSYNNLSGRLPELKAQFGTFTKESYEGNPLLCGPPLEKKCTATSHVTDPSAKEGAKEGSDKWYEVDMVSFYGSSGSACVVFLLGYVAVLYINPYWRRRWLDFVEECMYTCYYFLEDSVHKNVKWMLNNGGLSPWFTGLISGHRLQNSTFFHTTNAIRSKNPKKIKQNLISIGAKSEEKLGGFGSGFQQSSMILILPLISLAKVQSTKTWFLFSGELLQKGHYALSNVTPLLWRLSFVNKRSNEARQNRYRLRKQTIWQRLSISCSSLASLPSPTPNKVKNTTGSRESVRDHTTYKSSD
ncbi:hypothetical protein OSB04_005728 [Centaurea solstitialis]|uniref:Uncharacterized protein n=1 Tax=Centaurea solstitialis TaxID=347529 RepID=A0AA38TP78_9ASTR|nr:hypothetical protein OSB04_005728 [Centaurea solstitialis]